MNTDYIVPDIGIREKQYRRNINSKGDTRYYNDSCKTIKEYAKEQNTVYDPITNQMLYGINANMKAFGVSDGTCNQINPLMFTPRYICGTGTAGGNRCVPDAYSIENFDSNCNGYKTTEIIIFIILVLIFIFVIYSKYKKIEI